MTDAEARNVGAEFFWLVGRACEVEEKALSVVSDARARIADLEEAAGKARAILAEIESRIAAERKVEQEGLDAAREVRRLFWGIGGVGKAVSP